MIVTVAESDWRQRAACLGCTADLFFEQGNNPDAIRCCHQCPVMIPCRLDALNDPQTDQIGVRGGLFAHQRVAILKRRRPHGTRRSVNRER